MFNLVIAYKIWIKRWNKINVKNKRKENNFKREKSIEKWKNAHLNQN